MPKSEKLTTSIRKKNAKICVIPISAYFDKLDSPPMLKKIIKPKNAARPNDFYKKCLMEQLEAISPCPKAEEILTCPKIGAISLTNVIDEFDDQLESNPLEEISKTKSDDTLEKVAIDETECTNIACQKKVSYQLLFLF